MTPRLLIRSLLILLALSALAPRSGADCPMNSGGTGTPGGSYSYQSNTPTWELGPPCGHWKVDLPAGTFSVSGGGAGGEYSCGTHLTVSDIYQVVGPATGTPLAFTVRMVQTGTVTASFNYYPFIGRICNSTSGSVRLTSGPTTNTSAFEAGYYLGCVDLPINGVVSIELAHVPGEPFLIAFDFGVSGSGAPATVNSVLSFTGLPEGYSIQSCQGYAAQPVPALARSWGSLKRAYR